MIRNKKGFTLVELLAVIVILAIILVIAVPQIIKTIDSAREGAFSSSAKLIATTAEKEYLARKTIGDTSFEGLDTIPCTDVVKENTNDYQSCDISFDENGKATVTLIGKGKFAGKYICNGNKTSAEVTEESCTLVALTVDANGGTNTVEYNAKYEASSTVTLTPPTAPEGKEFDKWEVSGTGASVTNNTLTMGTTATTVKAIWKDAQVTATPVNFSTDSWSTIAAAVSDGTYPSEYTVGLTKEIELDIDPNVAGKEKYHLRVANTTPCDGTLSSQTACGFVLEFVEVIGTHAMNSSNAGGWPASGMRKYLNDIEASDNTDGVIYNKLVEEIGDIIIDTTVVSSHGSEDSANFTSTDKIYLLSPQEVYGDSFTHDYDSSNGTSRQLDYYGPTPGIGVTTSSCSGAIKYPRGSTTASSWWLRSAYSKFSNTFYNVGTSGGWSNGTARSTYGVSPAFRIGNVS